jgi:exodeoxyribonuclease III
MRFVSWNVNGLRAVHGRGDLKWAFEGDVDVIALQETKIQPEMVSDEMKSPPGWRSFWSHGKKKGYSGTAIYVRDKFKCEPFEFLLGGDFDDEGRLVGLDFGAFVLLCIYFPNGASGPDRLAFKTAYHEAFFAKVTALARERSVVVCGDPHISHKTIDVAKPEKWSKESGFLPEERAWLDRFLAAGFIDSYRADKGDLPRQYTFWETRVEARRDNFGWRIDYFFISKDLEEKLVEAWISPQIYGSDHCPVGIELSVDVDAEQSLNLEGVEEEEEDEAPSWRR